MHDRGAAQEFEGVCLALFVFDIGQSIDLERTGARLGCATHIDALEHAPIQFQFARPPLGAKQACEALAVGAWRTKPELELALFEFGAVSVTYSLQCSGDLGAWTELSCALAATTGLADAARRRAEELMRELGDCIGKPGVAEVSETYVVFRFGPLAEGIDSDAFVAGLAPDLARLLRSERGALSAQEIADALNVRVSFQANDLALIDWNAAAVFDDAPEDVVRVLEFANVELLEMRFLDVQLDRSLDRAYEMLARRNWGGRIMSFGLHRDLDRLSSMQVDGAILFERVGNTLKLVSDQYLARALRATSQRFRLGEWNSGILRKLETLDAIYEKIHDHAAALRAEFLELIVILLIVLEIVMAFVIKGH
jgi:hypothetical protein